jgi:tryptophanyl-tRNA synthetase
LYGETFVLPEPVIPTSGGRILALNDPTVKMSKSDLTRGHGIRIVDEPDEIRWTIRRAVTDPGREIIFSSTPEKAGVNNLLQIYEALTGMSREAIEAHFAGQNYGKLKNDVTEVAIETLRPVRERFRGLQADPAELDRLLAVGAERARAVAEPKIAEVKSRIGLTLPV